MQLVKMVSPVSLGSVVAALCLGSLGASVQAGPISERFSAIGHVEFGIAPEVGHFSMAGDADASFNLGAGFAFNLGLYGAATDLTGEIDTPHETYGTLSWQGNRLAFAIGVPRPAYDSMALSSLERWDPVRAIAADIIGATRSRATWGAIHNGDLPLGLRVDGTEAGFTWAFSAHQMDGVEVAGAAVDFSPAADPMLRIGLAAEYASDGNHGAKASVDRQFGSFSVGGSLFLSPVAQVSDFVEARAGWQISPELDLNLAYLAPRDGAETAILGVERHVGQHGYLKGAVRVEGDDVASMFSFGLTFGR